MISGAEDGEGLRTLARSRPSINNPNHALDKGREVVHDNIA